MVGGARCAAPRCVFAIEAVFLRFLRLLPDAAPLCRHGNRRGVLRQEEVELGGLSQGPGADSLPLLLRGATVRGVSAEARLGGAGIGRGRGQSWWRARQWALAVAAGGVKNL